MSLVRVLRKLWGIRLLKVMAVYMRYHRCEEPNFDKISADSDPTSAVFEEHGQFRTLL